MVVLLHKLRWLSKRKDKVYFWRSVLTSMDEQIFILQGDRRLFCRRAPSGDDSTFNSYC